MDPIRKIPKKVTKKFVNKIIIRQYFHRQTGLKVITFLLSNCIKNKINHFIMTHNLRG